MKKKKKSPLKLLPLLLCSMFFFTFKNTGTLLAQAPIGTDINGDAAGDLLGNAVSMPNATTVAIGSYLNDGNGTDVGHTRVLQWNGNNWVQLGSDIEGEGVGDQSGWSVSMPTSNTVAIGARFNNGNGSDAGHVRIYEWNGSVWLQKGEDIDGAAAGDLSAWSISMPDANTIAIGGYNHGEAEGHVRIYNWNGNAWIQKGNDIDGEAQADHLGVSVSMPNANTVAVGAYFNDGGGTDAGHVRIYEWNGTNWVQKGNDIDGEAAFDWSGWAICMPDVNTIGIGARLNDGGGTDAGHVRIYQWDGTNWIQKGNDIDGEEAGEHAGDAISMPNANTIAVGVPNSNENGNLSGSVRIYEWNGTEWVQKFDSIAGEKPGDLSGGAISMPDGNTIAIGATHNDGNGNRSGHVRVYDLCSDITIDTHTACDSYTWIDGNTYTTNNNTATYNLTNEAGCDSTIVLDLLINTVDISVSNNDPTLIANQAGASYQWIDCDNENAPISGETNQSFSPTVNGSYAVIVTRNNCSDTSSCYTVGTVNVENTIAEKQTIVIYPNPSNGIFQLDYHGTTAIPYTITNVMGEQIQTGLLTRNNNLLDISKAAAGIYFINMNEETLRLIKE